jgi:hypothetical protein
VNARARSNPPRRWLAAVAVAVAVAVALSVVSCERTVRLGVDPASDAATVDGAGADAADAGAE